jgi:hypothetical protein
MLKYRLKCVKNNTDVKPKGYFSDAGQTSVPTLQD